MPLQRLEIRDFRCIAQATLELDPELTLITGANASGKTSVLEACFFLGRGRSFRASAATALVRHGSEGFLVAGQVAGTTGPRRLGVAYRSGEFRVRVDGQERQRLADLAALVPVVVVDPEVHALVQGAPEQRRRFVDWGVFHVEPGFADTWRRYQRALRQRNAALKSGAGAGEVAPWTAMLAEAGDWLSAAREAYLERLSPAVGEIARRLLGAHVSLEYRRGWPRGRGLAEALAEAYPRDAAAGATQLGVHRADVRIGLDSRDAREHVSRGQQKLLAATLVLAQLQVYAQASGAGTPLLLLDDPAAELDEAARGRLLAEALGAPAQRIVTALEAAALPVMQTAARFHVKQGQLRQVL